MAGDGIFIATDLNNTSSQQINCTYITEVIDRNGYTEFMNWTKVSLPSTNESTVANIWIPEASGNYTVYSLFMNDIYNAPMILAQKQTSPITIS